MFWCFHGNSYLVRVNGHACRQSNYRDPVESGGVGDGSGSQVVVGLRRVAHQDSIDLQKEEVCAYVTHRSHVCVCVCVRDWITCVLEKPFLKIFRKIFFPKGYQ